MNKPLSKVTSQKYCTSSLLLQGHGMISAVPHWSRPLVTYEEHAHQTGNLKRLTFTSINVENSASLLALA
jgi:hypothetical protein